jgi:hypothetical protein
VNLRGRKEMDRSSRRPEAPQAILILVPILTIAGIMLWALQIASAATGLLPVAFIHAGQGDTSYTYLPLVVKASPPTPTPTFTPTATPIPSPTPGTVVVYDMYGNVRDLNWAWEKYGVWIEETSPGPDGSVFRIVELREQSGPANIDVWVFDEGGEPMAGVTVRKTWPEDQVEQITDIDGRTGFAMGGGDKHPEGTSGPLSFEVVASAPSDVGRGFGWLGGTEHDHLNIVFRLMR